MHVHRKNDELLPVNDPIAGKDQQKKHEPGVGEHCAKVFCGLTQAGSLDFTRAAGFTEENQHGEEHSEHAYRRDAENILDAHVAMDPGRYIRSSKATNIYERVV